jgi:hypothetical protein
MSNTFGDIEWYVSVLVFLFDGSTDDFDEHRIDTNQGLFNIVLEAESFELNFEVFKFLDQLIRDQYDQLPRSLASLSSRYIFLRTDEG